MKRKGLFRLLSFALALMLPLSALAQSAAIDLLEQAKKDGKEVVTTITFTPGQELASNAIVSEMSAATAIRLSKLPGGLGGLTISLQGVDVLTLLARVQADGLYLQSETLGKDPLYFSWEDVNKYITSSMSANGTNAMQIEQFSSGFSQAIANVFSDKEALPATIDEAMIKERITQSMGGDDTFVKWIEEIQSRAVTTAGDYTVGESDKADTKIDLTITAEDIAKLWDAKYNQDMMAKQIRTDDSTLTDDQVVAKVKDETEKLKKDTLDSKALINASFYKMGATDLVAFVIDASGINTQSADKIVYTNATVEPADTTVAADATTEPAAVKAPENITMHMQFTRQTLADGKKYAVLMNADKDGVKTADANAMLTVGDQKATGEMSVSDGKAQLFTMGLTADYADPKNISGQWTLAVLDPTSPIAIALDFTQKTGDTTVDTAVSASYATTLDEIKADAAKALLGTVQVNALVQADSGMYATLKEATPQTSLALLTLNDDDMAAYFGKLQSNAIQLVYKVFANLPENTAKLVTGMMNGSVTTN